MPHYPLGPRPGGNASKLNLSATTVVKATPGTCYTVNVTTAGGTTGAIYDNNSTSAGNTAAHLIATIPEAVGTYTMTFPAFTGIVFVPGTSMVASIAYS